MASSIGKQFVVLIRGTMWSFGNIHLTNLTENGYKQTLDGVSQEERKMIDRGVELGTLAISKAPHVTRQKVIREADSAKAKRKPIVQLERIGRLEWTDLKHPDVQANKRPAKAPNISQKSATYSEKDSIAFRLIQDIGSHIVELLPGMIGAMKSDTDRLEFLKELEYIEAKGFNKVAAPRHEVVRVIDVYLKQYQKAPIAMSPISVIEEPEMDDQSDVKSDNQSTAQSDDQAEAAVKDDQNQAEETVTETTPSAESKKPAAKKSGDSKAKRNQGKK